MKVREVWNQESAYFLMKNQKHLKMIFCFHRPVRPAARPVGRSNRNDDYSPSYAKPSGRQAPPARNKAAPGGPQKKTSQPSKPGAGVKPKVDSGRKNKVRISSLY